MMKMFIKLCLAFTSLFCSSSYAKDPLILKVGLITPERPPYFFSPDQGAIPTGLYIDILERITQDLPVKLTYHFLPQARVRMYMEKGLLDIEPGIDLSWRLLPEEMEQTTYTIPFMKSDEVYAYIGKDKSVIDTTKGNSCGINGFNMPATFNVRSTHLVTTEKQLFSMILNKRCDTAIAPIDVLNYWNSNSLKKINHSDIVISYQLRFRLNKQHKGIIQALNNNINKLLVRDEIKSIKKKYML